MAVVPGTPILSIAESATAAEPQPQLPATIRSALAQAANASYQIGGAVVTVSVPGRDTVGLDLTPMRGASVENVGNRRDTAIAAKLADLDTLLREATSAVSGLDLIALLDKAARGNGGAPVVALSSGVSTQPPLDLRQWAWPDEIAPKIMFLAARHYLPAYLVGREVHLYYLGDVAGRQPALPTSARLILDRVYVAICRVARATECVAEEDSPSSVAPRATMPVPVVDVPAWTLPLSQPGTPCEVAVDIPTTLLFRPDSPALTPEADAALAPLARRIVDLNGRLIIALIRGHTSDAGPGDGRALSLQRAHAVAGALVALGVKDEWIRTVDGVGEGDQIAPDWNSDGSPSPQAARNRRVEIKMTSIGCATSVIQEGSTR